MREILQGMGDATRMGFATKNTGSKAELGVDEYQLAIRKIELPSFDGTDQSGWIVRAEKYFQI